MELKSPFIGLFLLNLLIQSDTFATCDAFDPEPVNLELQSQTILGDIAAEELFDFPYNLIDSLQQRASQSRQGRANGRFGWVRDYYPQVGVEGKNTFLVKYVNPSGGIGTSINPLDATVPVVNPPDVPAYFRRIKLGKEITYAEVRTFPGILEGGALQVTRDRNSSYVFLSEKVMQQNRLLYLGGMIELGKLVSGRDQSDSIEFPEWLRNFRDEMQSANFKIPASQPTDQQIFQSVATTYSVPEERVIRFPFLPGEVTGHIDIWLGIIHGNILAVPYIPERLIQTLDYGHEKEFSMRVNHWLNEQTARLNRLGGVRALRIPMLPPKNLRPSSISDFGWDATFMSPVNWVVKHQTVFVPEHRKWIEQLSPELRDSIRAEITAELIAIGFKVVFVAADQLFEHGGGLHCVTADYPAIRFEQNR